METAVGIGRELAIFRACVHPVTFREKAVAQFVLVLGMSYAFLEGVVQDTLTLAAIEPSTIRNNRKNIPYARSD